MRGTVNLTVDVFVLTGSSSLHATTVRSVLIVSAVSGGSWTLLGGVEELLLVSVGHSGEDVVGCSRCGHLKVHCCLIDCSRVQE